MTSNDILHATHDATILLRTRVSQGRVPSLGDTVLLNAALHLEGRPPAVRSATSTTRKTTQELIDEARARKAQEAVALVEAEGDEPSGYKPEAAVLYDGTPGSGSLVRPVTSHIRATLPRRGGNSFYKDRRDLSAYAVSLCGAAITDKDISYREAGAKGFREGGQYAHLVCRACQVIRAAN